MLDYCPALSKVGTLMQVFAALYIVIQAYRTAKSLAGMKVTIDSLEHIILHLGQEMRDQFKHQLIGFVVMALGASLQMLC